MNSVDLIGRLTRDPQIRYTADQLCIASFSIAVERGDKDKHVDYPNIKVFGKQAENVEKYIKKGRQVGIHGRIQTGSYEGKNGTVYTTDIVADKVEFLGQGEKPKQPSVQPEQMDFVAISEDVPF